jgi:hypothetical protein
MTEVVVSISLCQLLDGIESFVKNTDGIMFCKLDARRLEKCAAIIRRKLEKP